MDSIVFFHIAIFQNQISRRLKKLLGEEGMIQTDVQGVKRQRGQ